MPISSQMLRPARGFFISATLIAALVVNLLPWQAQISNLAPDFVALLLLYWCVNQPRRIGVGAAFVLGLLMDVADANVLGQHALAYSVIAGLALWRYRQIAIYPFWQQALVVLLLLLLDQLIMVGVRALLGAAFVGWTYFLGSFLAALLWTPLSNLMLFQQRKPASDEL